MSINLNNYESYFTLYLDNELNPTEKRMVEAFLKAHPNLKEELEFLSQFKLTPDNDIVFEGKEGLMMHEESKALTPDLQESLLLYVDNEITVAQKLSLNELISINPVAKAELALLERAKLKPEEIIFRDKSSLYRKEETRIYSFRWRAAAAAILLIAVGLTTFIIVNRKPADQGLAKGTIEKSNNNQSSPPSITNEAADKPVNEIVKQTIEPASKNNIASTANTKKENLPIRASITANTYSKKVDVKLPGKIQDVLIAENKPSNNLPAPLNNANNDKDTKAVTVSNDINTVSDVTSTKPQPYIVQAAFDTDAAVDQPDEKKGKLRGFFRKVTRTFEKRTNIETTNDDNKLLVGGLAFKLK